MGLADSFSAAIIARKKSPTEDTKRTDETSRLGLSRDLESKICQSMNSLIVLQNPYKLRWGTHARQEAARQE